MIAAKKYNTDLNRGIGLFQETVILLGMYLPNDNKDEFVQKVVDSNAMAKVSEKRIRDIVKDVFYKRYVNENPEVALYLNDLHKSSISLDQLIQIFLIYTARINIILFDFISEVYWDSSKITVTTSEARIFILEAVKYGKIDRLWSEGTQKKIASYILSSLVDFKYVDKKGNKLPVFANDLTVNYLAHELHFKGVSDESLVQADEWKLFGYNRYDTIKHLERISFQGHFILQNSGELIKITWYYQNMKDFIYAVKH
jgi:hypothetical protein